VKSVCGTVFQQANVSLLDVGKVTIVLVGDGEQQICEISFVRMTSTSCWEFARELLRSRRSQTEYEQQS